ncbi:hypothetical protein LSAT2_027490 [Lamellibrachia satsuma]|nr:hypothetical protein LSAT2_027490 [Lamellibrachia satsuma]
MPRVVVIGYGELLTSELLPAFVVAKMARCLKLNVSEITAQQSVSLRVALTTQSEAEDWLRKLQTRSFVTWRVASKISPKEGGRNVFRTNYRCQHNTLPRSTTADLRRASKNTLCQASLYLTLKRSTVSRGRKSSNRAWRASNKFNKMAQISYFAIGIMPQLHFLTWATKPCSGSHAGEGEVPLVRASSMSSIAAMPTVLQNVPFPTKLIMDADNIIEALDDYCLGETNETYERYVFFTRDQRLGEKFDSYVATLHNLAKTCNFKELEDGLIRDRIVLRVVSKATRKRLLAADKLTKKSCIHICRGDERMESQMTSLSPANTPPDDVHGVTSRRDRTYTSRPATMNRRRQANDVRASGIITCKYCGRDHARKKETCPAWGDRCSTCGRRNHFAKMCLSKNTRRVHGVDRQSEDSDTESDTTLDDRNPHVVTIVQEHGRPVHAVDSTRDRICVVFTIKRKRIVFQVDSGASVNLISAKLIADVPMTPTTKTLTMWNNSTTTHQTYNVPFVVVEQEDFIPLIGNRAAQQMHIITVDRENFRPVAMVANQLNPLTQFQDVFGSELGCLPGEAHISVDTNVTPTISPTRRVPEALKKPLKAELKRMVEQKVTSQLHGSATYLLRGA